MLDYNKLFDVAYSDTLPEAVKASIFENVLESIGAELNESLQTEDSYYASFLNTLINSTITEACLYDVIETTFSSLSEAEVEVLTEEFIKASVVNYISEAGFGTPRPIGLAGLRKEWNKGEEKAPQPQATKPSAMDKLKSAVGKVKSWVDKVREVNRPSTIAGINKLQAEKDARIKRAVEMGTGPKVNVTTPHAATEPKAEEHHTEVHTSPKEERKQKLEDIKARVERHNKRAEDVKRAESAVPMGQRKEESKEDKIASRVAKHNERAQKIKAEEAPSTPMSGKVEEPSKEVKVSKSKATKKSAIKATSKVDSEKKIPKKKQTSTKKADTVATNVAKAVEPKKEKVKVKRGRKPKNTNEAIADFVCLLSGTNISESAVEEIVEMISNKKTAKKAVEKEYKEFTKAADTLNDLEKMSAKSGLPLDKEKYEKLAKKAEKKGERYEHFKALADKKFGS